jgi:hypothetical protein
MIATLGTFAVGVPAAQAHRVHSTHCVSMRYSGGHVTMYNIATSNRAFSQGETDWAYFITALGNTQCGFAESVMASALRSGDDVTWLRAHKARLHSRVYRDLKVNGKTVPYAIVTVRMKSHTFTYGRIPPPSG